MMSTVMFSSRQMLQQLQDLLAGLIVERAGRLVAQQQLRLLGDCARNGHALLFAAGQLRREIVQPVAQADLVQGVGRVEMVGADLRREFDVSNAVRFGTRL